MESCQVEIPPASFTEGSVAPHHYTVLTAPNQSLSEAMGLPPETRLVDAGLCSATTIKAGRRWVQVRRTPADVDRPCPAPAARARVTLALVPKPAALSENQHQQADDHQKANQKNDADRATEKLEHEGASFGWVHLLRLGYRRIVQWPEAKADG